MEPDELAEGLYRKLVTDRLAEQLQELTDLDALREPVDPAEAHVTLSRHLHDVVRDVLGAVPKSQRPAVQVALINAVLDQLADSGEPLADGGRVASPPEFLAALLPPLLPGEEPPRRPTIPLSDNDLLVNGRNEPAIGSELKRELESADRVDLLIAFVKWYGVRILRDELAALRDRDVPLRVLTTTYMGATERRALDWLAELGADIRVSYERSTTRLHAKAWLFHRKSGFSTAYIGSSNLSKSALLDGLEWNVRLAEAAAPDVVAKFRATFESYWQAGEFEPYDPDRDGERFEQATSRASGGEDVVVELSGLEIRPWHYQREILEALDVERQRHDRWRNLVVAPTGTGKTVVAAFDYQRLRDEARERGEASPSLLFVAHRERILTQSLRMFREVLGDGSFGELLVGGRRPSDWRHVFASIQSLTAIDVETLDPDQFDVVIVDEFHHAAAPTYRALLEHVEPKVLLGLTATPERTDGTNVNRFFGGRYAFEMRLWDALDERLLAPFQYFGVADDVDLSELEWTRGGYRISDLDNLYTGNDVRVRKVIGATRDLVGDVGGMRAFGFCVSKAHAAYMARRFNEAGIPATYLVAETPEEERQEALRRLRDRDLNAVFAVDLLTEGVDVPEVDTILLLRPTESATVFLQQIGRGLRKTATKACCTILDFIGQQHRKFRFDLRLRAMTGASRAEVTRRVEEGFPLLPAGCHIELDRVSEEVILDNLRQSLRIVNRTLVPEVQELARRGELSLNRLLEETGAELHELYKRSIGGWSQLRRRADVEAAPPFGPEEESLALALGRSLHWDDPERLELYAEVAAADTPPNLDGFDARQRRLLTMLHLSLWGLTEDPATLEDGLRRLWEHPGVVEDLRAVLPLLADTADHVTRPMAELAEVPLHVHARYSRDEVLAALGELEPGSTYAHREGVFYDEPSNTDVFFVTLHKSERDYSPTTMYEDYAISPRLFHWESQSTTSRDSPTGRRYLAGASRVVLMVRDRKEGHNGAAPYLNLGPASFVEASGDRPIAITWRLDTAMPEDAFHQARVAATA